MMYGLRQMKIHKDLVSQLNDEVSPKPGKDMTNWFSVLNFITCYGNINSLLLYHIPVSKAC